MHRAAHFDISAYERVTLGKLPGLLKTTLLITKNSGAMHCYLCMQIGDPTKYQRAKTMIVNYCRTSTLTTNIYTTNSRGAEAGPAPMEHDAFHHRQG